MVNGKRSEQILNALSFESKVLLYLAIYQLSIITIIKVEIVVFWYIIFWKNVSRLRFELLSNDVETIRVVSFQKI